MYRQIVDTPHDGNARDIGPASGLLAAHAAYPQAGWLVVACDLPLLDDRTIRNLIAARDSRHAAVTLCSPHDGRPEPFCAIWEPVALDRLHDQVRCGCFAPRDALVPQATHVLAPSAPDALDNINTPEEHARALRKLTAKKDVP